MGTQRARFYRDEDDSEEDLEFNSDDEYESDVPQDSLGRFFKKNISPKFFFFLNFIHSGRWLLRKIR